MFLFIVAYVCMLVGSGFYAYADSLVEGRYTVGAAGIVLVGFSLSIMIQGIQY